MASSMESMWSQIFGERTYDDAVVYGDAERESVLHEGSVRVLGNGWIELPSGRLLSPSAVHHIDRRPD